MEYVYGIGIIVGILFFLLVFIPVAMVKCTEWESDKEHPVYITRQYINKIGWRTAHNQQLSLFVSWASLMALLNNNEAATQESTIIIVVVCFGAGYWFIASFKGLFQQSTNWYDNSVVMVGFLGCITAVQLLDTIGFLCSMFLGAIVSIWWTGRLMMYKAIRDKNA